MIASDIDNTLAIAMIRSALFMFYLVFGVVTIVGNRKHEQYKYIMSALLFLWSFELAKDGLSQFFPWYTDLYIRNLYLLFDITAIPLCALFVVTLTYTHWLTVKRLVLNLLPYACGFAAYALTRSEIVFYAALICVPICYAGVMLPFILHGLKLYNKAIDDNYSYRENINIGWLRTIVWLFVIDLGFCIFLYAHISVLLFVLYYAYCLAMWIYIIAKVNSYERPKWLPESDVQLPPTDKVVADAVPIDKIGAKLDAVIVSDESFMNPHLTMQDVAARIGTNRTYLSKYLNRQRHITFYDYVNAIRLGYAERMIVETPEKISYISEECGFSHYSTFVRAFRAKYGCTPVEYRHKVISERTHS